MTDPNKDYPQCYQCDARDVPLRYDSINPKTGQPEGEICEGCYCDPSTDAEAGPAFDDCEAANEEAAIEDARWKEAIASRRISQTGWTPEAVEELQRKPHDVRLAERLAAKNDRYPDQMTRPSGRQGDE